MPKDCECKYEHPTVDDIEYLKIMPKRRWTWLDWAKVYYIKFGHGHLCTYFGDSVEGFAWTMGVFKLMNLNAKTFKDVIGK